MVTLRSLFIAVTVGLLPGLAMAQPHDDPRALLEAFYAPYFGQADFDQEAFYSVGLRDLYARDAQEANGEMGRLDFDPYIQGQDWDTLGVEIGRPEILGGTARVAVDFENFGQPMHLVYSLVLERDGWKIDDAWWTGQDGGPDGSVRVLLAAPWPY